MNKKQFVLTCFSLLLAGEVMAQPAPRTYREELSYFMPKEWLYTLDDAVPVPEKCLGFQVGQQHVNWEQVVLYMKMLAAVSPRFSIREYGYTAENRPLLCVVITSEKNQKNLAQLQDAHRNLADPAADVDVKSLPAVVSIMNTIHGNEPSGVNSTLPFAYFFAAAEGPEIDALLDKVIITLIPGQNPDGITRFSTWVNANRSLRDVADPQSREFGETWPGGRSNHYWHDMNRDWINATQPEMKALLKIYHEWMPNLVSDHHEMGTNMTFFLEPADPVSYYPFIPEENKQLTARVSEYNMKALDRLGSLYLSKDLFDSYSLGTGDVYGDAMGSVAMLFEQASSRGHQQETDNGLLTFPFMIRNQITCAFGTVKAGYEMRETLNEYMHRFVLDRYKETQSLPEKGYVFDGDGSDAVCFHFMELLRSHDLDVNRLAKTTTINGRTYDKEHAFIIPTAQKNSMILRSLMERTTYFKDSLFYDVSTWNMAEAYGLRYDPVKSVSGLVGEKIEQPVFPKGTLIGGKSNYAYLFDNKEYYAPYMIKALQESGVSLKVSGTGLTSPDGYAYGPGLLIVPVTGQKISSDSVYMVINKLAVETGIQVRGVSSSRMNDFDMGHFYNQTIKEPKVAILVGSGMPSGVCGSLWYLMDKRFQMRPTLLDNDRFAQADLSRYNVLILSGTPSGGEVVEKKVSEWVKNGGTLITIGHAYTFSNKAELTDIQEKKLSQPDSTTYVAYNKRADYSDMFSIPGTDLRVQLDPTHPLGWGYADSIMPVIKNSTLVFDAPKEANKCPVWYDKKDPLLSGFLRADHKESLIGMPEVICESVGRGQVISFVDDLNFRSTWFAGTRMFMNAVFFGNMIR